MTLVALRWLKFFLHKDSNETAMGKWRLWHGPAKTGSLETYSTALGNVKLTMLNSPIVCFVSLALSWLESL